MLGNSLISDDGKVLGSDEGINMEDTDGKLLGTIIGNVDDITLSLDVGTNMWSLNGSFDDSNDNKLKGLLLIDSLGYTEGKVLDSDEGIKM